MPTVGEYVTTRVDSPLHRVVLVIHCPFAADYAAEVFAVEDSRAQHEVIKDACEE